MIGEKVDKIEEEILSLKDEAFKSLQNILQKLKD